MLKMPVNSLSETKRVEKSKLSLSLNRNASFLSGNRNRREVLKENTEPSNGSNCSNSIQERAQKRPLSSTYLKTLNAAKKLKTSSETKPTVSAKPLESKHLVVLPPRQRKEFAMLNGDHLSDNLFGNGVNVPVKKVPVASLSNLGNTCFLNSVLYTLRYAPRFLHNLHQLVTDLSNVDQKLGSIRLKSSSLGRNAASLAASGTRSWSSKDLLSLGQSDNNTGKSKNQVATEKLHETYANMRLAETKCMNSNSNDSNPDPFAADAFLAALREVNSVFEGNRQQDAHELLICILNTIRETCRALATRAARLPTHENGDSNGLTRQPSLDSESSKPTLGNLRKSWKKRKEQKANCQSDSSEERASTPPAGDFDKPAPGWDFVADDFEGTMVVRTRCMECERAGEHRQAACDVSVSVPAPDAGPEPYRAAATAADTLADQNKYWCGFCLRHVEARRTVGYARLPRLLVLQLKRFSGGMQKITQFAPTPMIMPCFCEPCIKRGPKEPPLHRYTLWSVIMHLGQTMTGGHYVAYARATPSPPCEGCGAGTPGTGGPNNATGGFIKSLFGRSRGSTTTGTPTGCSARTCCTPSSPPAWLCCDDDTVTHLSDTDMEDVLSEQPKQTSAATPYLLFYSRSDL